MGHHSLQVLLPAALTAAIAGCGVTNPYTPSTTTRNPTTIAITRTASSAQNPGELPAPPPPTPASQQPARLQSTPERAIAQFAALYTNWTWRTLAADQLTLARVSVGAARLSEQQAAAADDRDSEIARAHLYNQGQLVSIARSLTNVSQWVIVTREQTAGNSQYDGLQAAYHITLATVTHLPDGWAISAWLPQN
jgi:type IV secretory pathway VirB10-like protein